MQLQVNLCVTVSSPVLLQTLDNINILAAWQGARVELRPIIERDARDYFDTSNHIVGLDAFASVSFSAISRTLVSFRVEFV